MKQSDFYGQMCLIFSGFGVFIGIGAVIFAYDYVITSPVVFITVLTLAIAAVYCGTKCIDEKIREAKENEEA